ncbi:hypothetical protein GCM10027090_06700 [Sinomonas soli]
MTGSGKYTKGCVSIDGAFCPCFLCLERTVREEPRESDDASKYRPVVQPCGFSERSRGRTQPEQRRSVGGRIPGARGATADFEYDLVQVEVSVVGEIEYRLLGLEDP